MKSLAMVFVSREMELAVEAAKRMAATSSPVLIEGESGTGKELIARLIHGHSDRRSEPFVAVNCGAIPETLFESEIFGYRAGAFTGAVRDKPGIVEEADGGVLFLDEIADLPLSIQAKLLRTLQENEVRRIGDTRTTRVDVRVISATNKNLEEEMKRRRFREDLFFRVAVLRIWLEPLRRRRADIPVLCDHFAAKYAALQNKDLPTFPREVLTTFSLYAWPGNVRELENEIQRLIALSGDGTIDPTHVSKRITDSLDPAREKHSGVLRERIACYEREIIRETLERYSWNKSLAARYLGLTRQGLHVKVRRLKIAREE